MDMILPAWPGLWIAIHGKTVEGEKSQEGPYPLVPKGALRHTKETLEERIEKHESVRDFMT
jgi:hypothetical protein